MGNKNEQINLNSLLEELNEEYVGESFVSREDFSVLKIEEITLMFDTLIVSGDLIKVVFDSSIPLFERNFHLEIPVKGIETVEDFKETLYDKKAFMMSDENLFGVCQDKFEDFRYELREFIKDKARVYSFDYC